MEEYRAMIAALEATGIPFREDGWHDAKTPHPAAPYGEYAIDGGDELRGDDHRQLASLTGTVDLFVKGSGLDLKNQVEEALDGCMISWELNSRQYEPDTRLTHYEWLFEVI